MLWSMCSWIAPPPAPRPRAHPSTPLQVQEEKAALGAKLDALRALVVQLESYDPDWEERERGECVELSKVSVGGCGCGCVGGGGVREWGAFTFLWMWVCM